MTRVLLTGICGFVGSHLAERILVDTDWHIVGLDAYTYAGHMQNIAHLDQSRITLVYHDLREENPQPHDTYHDIEYVIHAAAESHVKNSFHNPEKFVESNIIGTMNLLNDIQFQMSLSPTAHLRKFLYVSTDEVFGASTEPRKEGDALNPSNPYAATKAAAEYLVRAYGRTYNIPWLITRSSNIYGSRQHREKYIPMVQEKIKRGQQVEIHCNGDFKIGSRQWIHASDQARAIIWLLQSEHVNEIFHIAGERKSNYEVADALGAGNIVLRNAFREYPAHDLHYSVDDSKIRAAGWQPQVKFEDGIKSC